MPGEGEIQLLEGVQGRDYVQQEETPGKNKIIGGGSAR